MCAGILKKYRGKSSTTSRTSPGPRRTSPSTPPPYTRVAKRDEHLKSPDFLDAARYPSLVFKSKKVEKAGAGKLKVTGDLTIREVTKEVVLDIEGPTPPIRDLEGKTRVGGVASTKINRKNFRRTR